jgi:hypothetical protein
LLHFPDVTLRGVGTFMHRILVLLFLLFASCAKVDSTGSAAGGADAPGGTTPAEDTIFSVEVKTLWENATETQTHATCTVTDATVPKQAVTGTPVSCTASIPEAQLYYSSLRFSISASTQCDIVTFRPFYYQISDSAAYTPPNTTTVVVCDGSTTPIPQACFGGAGTNIITNLGTNTGLYFLPGFEPSRDFEAISGNTKRQSAPEFSGLENRWTVNNLPAASRAVTVNDVYLQNTWQDWQVICRDEWDEPLYRMTIDIIDANSDVDQLETWQ